MKYFVKILGLLLIITVSLFARGKNDLLFLPSPKMPINIIKKAMFLDIVNTGKKIVAVGEQGFIIYSEDNGKTWKQADVPVRVTLTGVSFPDDENGWAVGNCGVILHSKDGGKTWKKQLDGFKANKLVIETLENILKNKSYDNNSMSIDDLKYFLKDAKETLKEGPIWPFLNVWFRDKNFGIAIGGFGRIFLTKDGGKHWISLLGKLNNPDGFHYYDIGELNNYIFIDGEGGIIFRGNNLATFWKALSSPSDSSFFGLKINQFTSSIIVYGMKGVAFESTDYGNSWKEIFSMNNVNKIIVSSIILKDKSFCLLSYDGQFFCKKKNSNKFKKMPIKLLGSIALCKGEDNYIFAAGVKGIHKIKVNFGEN